MCIGLRLKYNIRLEFIAVESAEETWGIADFKAKIRGDGCNSRAGLRHLNLLVKSSCLIPTETLNSFRTENELL